MKIIAMFFFVLSFCVAEEDVRLIQIGYRGGGNYLYAITNSEYNSLPVSNPSIVDYPTKNVELCNKAYLWLQTKFPKVKIKMNQIYYNPVLNKDDKIWYAVVSFCTIKDEDLTGINSVVILPNGKIVPPKPIR